MADQPMRTVHVRVTYRLQIPADVQLDRIMIDHREVDLPPLLLSSGEPAADGGQGTVRHESFTADFLTYSELWGEGEPQPAARPVIEELIERSSLGTPEAAAARASVPRAYGRLIAQLANARGEVERVTVELADRTGERDRIWKMLEIARQSETTSDGTTACPVTHEGYPCRKTIPVGWLPSEGHGGGHWFASDEIADQMRTGHYDARAALAGEEFGIHRPQECPGPDHCATARREVARG